MASKIHASGENNLIYQCSTLESFTPSEIEISQFLSELIFCTAATELAKLSQLEKPLQQTSSEQEINIKRQRQSHSHKSGKSHQLSGRVKIYTKNDPNWRCNDCKTPGNQTPLIRNGPEGNKTLCNACGVKWLRSTHKKS